MKKPSLFWELTTSIGGSKKTRGIQENKRKLGNISKFLLIKVYATFLEICDVFSQFLLFMHENESLIIDMLAFKSVTARVSGSLAKAYA